MGSIWLRQEYKVIGWNGGPFHHCLKNSLRWNVFSFLVSVGPKFWVHGHSSESFLADCLEFRSTMADYASTDPFQPASCTYIPNPSALGDLNGRPG